MFFDALEEGINHRAAYFFFRAEDAEIEDEVSFVVEVVFECFILFIELVHELFECFFVVLLLGALSDKETDDAVDALVKDDDDWQSCVSSCMCERNTAVSNGSLAISLTAKSLSFLLSKYS